MLEDFVISNRDAVIARTQERGESKTYPKASDVELGIKQRAIADQGVERLGVLAHELRNLINTAMLSFEIIKSGRVGPGGVFVLDLPRRPPKTRRRPRS